MLDKKIFCAIDHTLELNKSTDDLVQTLWDIMLDDKIYPDWFTDMVYDIHEADSFTDDTEPSFHTTERFILELKTILAKFEKEIANREGLAA